MCSIWQQVALFVVSYATLLLPEVNIPMTRAPILAWLPVCRWLAPEPIGYVDVPFWPPRAAPLVLRIGIPLPGNLWIPRDRKWRWVVWVGVEPQRINKVRRRVSRIPIVVLARRVRQQPRERVLAQEPSRLGVVVSRPQVDVAEGGVVILAVELVVGGGGARAGADLPTGCEA